MNRPSSVGALILVLGLGGAVGLGVIAARADQRPAVAAAVILASALLLLAAGNARLPLVAAILLFFASETDLARQVAVFSMGVKGGALVMCVLAGIRCQGKGSPPKALTGVAVCAVLAYSWAGLNHPSVAVVVDLLAVLLAVLALRLVARHVAPEVVGQALDVALALSLVTCLLMPFAPVGTPLRGDRLQGFFANANTLGFLAAAAVLRGMFATRSSWRVPYAAVAALALIWAGSRSPVLAAGVGLAAALGHALVKSGAGKRRLLGVLVLVSSVAVLFLDRLGRSDLIILRTTDSRTTGTEYAFQQGQTHPWTGLGYGQSLTEVASSPLRWLAETGWPGLVLVGIGYAWILVMTWRASWLSFLVGVFGIVHSLFEGWFFAGGSSLFFLWWLLLFSAEATSRPARPREADPSTDTDPRRAGRVGSRPAGRVPAS